MAKQTNYLTFSANSIKDLIKQNLNTSGIYTDQLFEDSNLTVLIDIFAWTYSSLMYYLNHTGTEGTFTDAQIYENINRIVKMLGYNPRGFTTASAATTMSIDGVLSQDGIMKIPKYATITTALVDSNGVAIEYTFTEDYSFVATNTTTISSNFIPVLRNGTWKTYSKLFTSTGIPFETFTLDELEALEGDNRIFIAGNFIDVYVKKPNGTFVAYSPVTNLYNSSESDLNFEVRINENKQYTMKFGDDIYGKKLEEGDTIYIVYLQSNGLEGAIGANQINTDLELNVKVEGLSEDFIKTNIIKDEYINDYVTFGNVVDPQLARIRLTNAEASTNVMDMETVEEIRTNAPIWFRIGSRLITNQDFSQYVLMNYSKDVYDISVMNNWEYMVEFQQWLKQYNKLSIDIRHYSYFYTDSCDFNNVYLWVQGHDYNALSKSVKINIERDIDRLKPVTSEICLVDPLLVTLNPYVAGTYDMIDFDTSHENKIEITRDRNTMITSERIKQKVVTTIQDFFALSNCELGMTIDITSLYNQLMAIDGVKTVRTKYLATGQPTNLTQYYDGLSFGIWTQHILLGADFTKISGAYKIKPFQFPFLLDSSTLVNKIEVTADTYQISDVEY